MGIDFDPDREAGPASEDWSEHLGAGQPLSQQVFSSLEHFVEEEDAIASQDDCDELADMDMHAVFRSGKKARTGGAGPCCPIIFSKDGVAVVGHYLFSLPSGESFSPEKAWLNKKFSLMVEDGEREFGDLASVRVDLAGMDLGVTASEEDQREQEFLQKQLVQYLVHSGFKLQNIHPHFKANELAVDTSNNEIQWTHG